MPNNERPATIAQNGLLCAAFSYADLKSKIGEAVMDDSNERGQLIDVIEFQGEIKVLIDCCSNMPYWMRAKHVRLLGSA